MPSRPWPPFLDPQDVLRHPDAWRQIGRSEALRLEAQGAILAVMSGTSPVVMRFDENSPFRYAFGPYDYASLRYYLHLGTGPAAPAAFGGAKRAVKPKEEAPAEAEELVPLESEEEEPEASPSPARKKEVAKEEPKEEEAATEVLELRFDLALDPATPGLEDDVFVLEGLDSEYRQAKSVRDDKVAGDGKLTLVFTEVEKGKRYQLSQQTGEAQLLLVPEVVCEGRKAEKGSGGGAAGTRAAPAPAAKASAQGGGGAGAGEVVGCKAAFRECRIQVESHDLWKMEETRYQFELAFAKGKWVYVFGGPQGGRMALLAEGLGTADGGFKPVDLKANRGKDERPALGKASAWITLPLKVNGKEWNLFACLSPIQLGWKRIVNLEKKPEPRCYRIGEATGGVCWVPGHIGREVPKLSKARDARIADPGKDIVMLGLYDHMAEAKRRAGIYHRELKPYLENRFDTTVKGPDGTEQLARRRKKHVAGLIKVLLEKHPQRKRLQDCLAQKGAGLDQFLRDEDERELALKKRANGAAASLAKWMDSPSRTFDSVLADYFTDKENTAYWERVEKDLAFLVSYCEVTSLMRLFSRRMVEQPDSFVNAWLLNKDRFPAIRKPTQVMVELINWLANVEVRSEKVRVEKLLTIYTAWLPGWKARIAEIPALGTRWRETRKSETEWFPNEAKASPSRERKIYFKALRTRNSIILYKEIQVSRTTKVFKQLEAMSDSSIVDGLLLGLELQNLALTIHAYHKAKDKEAAAWDIVAAGVDLAGFVGETIGASQKWVGRGALASLSVIGSILDFNDSLNAAGDAYVEKDYDKMAAKLAAAVGSASMAVGSGMVAATVFGSMGAGANLLTAGMGLSMTGAGSVPGAVAFLMGAMIVAGATIASVVLIEEDFEIWLSECPFGITPAWSFGDRIATHNIAVFHELLHPVKVDAVHEFLQSNGKYVITITGPWNEHMKVDVKYLELVDSKMRKCPVLRDEILSDAKADGFEVKSEIEDEISISISISDEKCWKNHKERYPDFDNVFKYARLDIRIDLYGDRELILPARTRKRPIVLPIRK